MFTHWEQGGADRALPWSLGPSPTTASLGPAGSEASIPHHLSRMCLITSSDGALTLHNNASLSVGNSSGSVCFRKPSCSHHVQLPVPGLIGTKSKRLVLPVGSSFLGRVNPPSACKSQDGALHHLTQVSPSFCSSVCGLPIRPRSPGLRGRAASASHPHPTFAPSLSV